VWSLPGGLLPSQQRRQSIVLSVLLQRTNKQTNKQTKRQIRGHLLRFQVCFLPGRICWVIEQIEHVYQPCSLYDCCWKSTFACFEICTTILRRQTTKGEFLWRDNVVYWKTKRNINNDLRFLQFLWIHAMFLSLFWKYETCIVNS